MLRTEQDLAPQTSCKCLNSEVLMFRINRGWRVDLIMVSTGESSGSSGHWEAVVLRRLVI